MAEDADICWAAKEDAVGVFGDDPEDLEDETANRCVGNAEEEGELEDGLTGASRDDGRRDFGKELGMESKLTAASILGGTDWSVQERRQGEAMMDDLLRCLASQVIPDVFYGHICQLRSDGRDDSALDLCKRGACKVARKLKVWRCSGHRSAIHVQVDGGWVRGDLEHFERNIRKSEMSDDYVKRCIG